MNVFIMPGAFYHDVEEMFLNWRFFLCKDIMDADLLCLTGGEDIHPSLYNQLNAASHVGREPSRRDVDELMTYKTAVSLGIPVLGICRGAQLICALNGGSLIQDMQHPHQHGIKDVRTGRVIQSSSIHHQLTVSGQNGTVIAVAEATPYPYIDAHGHHSRSGWVDEEVIWYPETRSLCIQGHPEVGPSEFTNYAHQLVKEFLCADM